MSGPRTVVVGAGFAGLAAARGLGRHGHEVLLIDRNNFHLFTPLLYQVASALLDPSEIAQPIRAVMRRHRTVDFLLANVTGFDLDNRVVQTDTGPVAYEHLVLAAGSATNYFGNERIERAAFPVKELGEALALRNHVLRVFEEAAATTDRGRRAELLSFAVAGGGPTGVEYAGALSELIRLVLRRDFPRLDLRQVRIHLLEAGDAILTPYRPRLRDQAVARLRQKGVEVHFGAAVSEVAPDRVLLQDGREIPCATVVWTAGVRASDLGGALGAERGRQGRVRVLESLSVPGHPEVFVAGDLAATPAMLPMLAPVAIQEGAHAAEQIHRDIAGAGRTRFQYRDRGIMATIGRNAAVVEIGPLHTVGFVGWITWLFVHLLMLVTFRSRLVVLVNWAWDYFFYDRPVRLLVAAVDR